MIKLSRFLILAAMSLGATAYITKPVHSTELAMTVEDVINKSVER